MHPSKKLSAEMASGANNFASVVVHIAENVKGVDSNANPAVHTCHTEEIGMVELKIKIRQDEDKLCASLEIDHEEIIAGYGDDPYKAMRDLIDEMEYQHGCFRPD